LIARPFIVAALAAGAAAAMAAELVTPVGPTPEPAPPWRVVGLPRQTKPMTHFTVVELEGHRVLQIESDHGYGNLVHPLSDVRAGLLSWRWRIDLAPVGADLQQRSGDDSALKVCALFDMPISRVPFFERQWLRLASSHAGEPLPTATLCYVWDNHLPAGTLLPNAFTHRLRYIVVNGVAGQWSDQHHDLAADFRRAFGEESSEVPPLSGLLIGADSDNTGSRSLAYLEALRLSPAP
jgi:hypothetical protein